MKSHRLAGRVRTAVRDRASRLLNRDVRPDARAGRPGAEFAGVLDGRHLWLAVADVGRDATLGLRLPDGTVERLTAEHEPAAPSAPPVLATRVDLAHVVASAAWADRVPTTDALTVVPIVVTPDGDQQPIWTPLRSLSGRERRPGSLRPGLQPLLRRSSDGTLALDLRHAAPSVRAVALWQRPEAIDVRVETSTPVTGARVLTDDEQGVIATLAFDQTGGGAVLSVTSEVPVPPDSACPVVVDAADGPRPVVRSDDDVADAEPATRMPSVVSADDKQQVRFGWNRAGHLVLIRRDVDPDTTRDEDRSGEDDSEVEARAGSRAGRPR